MAQPRKLSPSELSQMMSGMSPQRATRFYNKCMTNPDTPQENINLLRQFRDQNPQMFLSEDQMKGDRGYKGSWVFGKGFSGGFREKPWGGVRDSDGFSYDPHGNRYDNYGNLVTGFTDGGSGRGRGTPSSTPESCFSDAPNVEPCSPSSCTPRQGLHTRPPLPTVWLHQGFQEPARQCQEAGRAGSQPRR